MINFGVIGAGWRSEFYLRIASLVPEKFNVTGMYIRNPQKQKEFSAKYRVKIFDNFDELISTNPDFIVSCVNKDGCCDMIELLCNKGIAVLSETPIGTSLSQIEKFEKTFNNNWKVQVAEQFHFQPQNQAYKEIIKDGILGEVHQVELSCCHDYHAISLIRFFLDIGDEIPKITTATIPDKLNVYNFRNGKFKEKEEKISTQKISVLEYNSKNAIYNFNCEQYFSDIRSSKIIIKGTNGEIVNNRCTYLENLTPITFEMHKNMMGQNENLDGMYLDSIVGNGKILYKNPYIPKRLTDEEISIATCLEKMSEYLKTNKDFYSLKEAILDSKTSLL